MDSRPKPRLRRWPLVVILVTGVVIVAILAFIVWWASLIE
jgi:hypothetical protein